MTTPLVAAYSKTPVRAFDVNRRSAVDALWLTRELGKVETALRTPTAATGGYFTLTDPQWGGDSMGRRDNSAAMRKVLDLIASDLTPVRAVYAPGGTYLFTDNWTATGGVHDDVTVFGDGPSTCFKLSDTPNTGNVEAGWMAMLTGTTDAPLRRFTIRGIRFDGSRTTTAWTDSSYGVVGYPDAVLEDCVVESCYFHDFLTDGSKTFTGGITFITPHTYDNAFNGLSVSVDTVFTGVANIYNHITYRNLGGLDVGRGCRTFVRGVEAFENADQGIKYSIGTLFLDIDGVHAHHNGVAATKGPGFTDTDTVGDGVIIIGTVVTHDNYGVGFRCTAANTLRIGRVISYDNACYVASSVAAYDILIGSSTLLNYVQVGHLYSENAPNHGILLDGDLLTYQIDSVEVVGAQDGGFVDNSNQAANGTVGQMVLRNNNRAGTAGASGAAVQVERTGTFTVGSAIFYDSQGSPTQTGGFYFSSGVLAKVGQATFGTGITTPYYRASSGTYILPELGWREVTNVSTTTTLAWVEDTVLVDATAGAVTVNLPGVAGMKYKTYTIKKVDASVNAVTIDPSGGELIDGAATYPLTAQWESITVQSDGTAWFVL